MQLRRLAGFIAIIQCILFLGHLLIYKTWTFAPAGDDPPALWIKVLAVVLSISFICSSLLAFRYHNAVVRGLYKVSAIWLGLASFLFFAAIFSWIVFVLTRLLRLHADIHSIVEWLFAAALVAGIYGLFNASWTRITRLTVHLANLPEAWRGRKAALISD